jgi:hypothetical protein
MLALFVDTGGPSPQIIHLETEQRSKFGQPRFAATPKTAATLHGGRDLGVVRLIDQLTMSRTGIAGKISQRGRHLSDWDKGIANGRIDHGTVSHAAGIAH